MKTKAKKQDKKTGLRQLLPVPMLLLMLLLCSLTGWGQTTIVTDGLNNSTTLFTLSGGAYYTGNSASGDRPASSPFAVEGTHSRGISNGTATLTSSNINTTGYSSIFMTFRLASFSITSIGNGADVGDIVTVEVSPNGGTNYYSTVRVLGNTNAYWSYTGGTGNASTAYDGDGTPVNYQPSAGGNRTTDGYSTVTITNLPEVSNLRLRITLLNNDGNERWVIDDFSVKGTASGCTAPTIQSSALGTNTPTTDGFSASWTAGNGNGTMIVVRPTAQSNTAPTSGTSYTANLAWGSAGTIDANNRVVFRAAGTSAGPLTGLNPQTQYTVTAYEYNNTDNCYNLSSPPTATRYTLSNEPTAQASGLTATAASGTQINLSWSAATFPGSGATTKGYVLLRATSPNTPALTSTDGQTPAGDANTTIVSSSIAEAATSYNNTGLAGSTTYNYLLVPFCWDGTNAATYNYLTTSAPTASATTYSASSDIVTANGESATVSSIENTAGPLNSTQGVQVWQFTIRDGGAAADADALPTIVNGITFSQNAGNAFGDWTDIRSADLFDGATHLATATITANQLQFTGAPIISVADDGSKTLSLRISLKAQVFASGNNDGDDFVFQISNTNVTTAASGSSGFSAFTAINSTNGQNVLAVVATELRFVQQPTNVTTNTNISPSVTVEGTDVNGNRDLAFAEMIKITATGATMVGGNATATAASGLATFASIQFSTSAAGVTLNAERNATSDWDETSSAFNVTEIIEQENFGTCPSANWITYSVIGPTDVWVCGSGYMSINGYGDENDEDWLILGTAINFNLYTSETFTFTTQEAYDGPNLELYYSSNYSGSGDPSSATWTLIPHTWNDVSTNGTFSTSYNNSVDLSGLTGSAYIAFKYTGTAGTAEAWRVDNILITGYSAGCISPATQATFNAFSGVTGTSITVNWTRGDGDYVLVVAKEASAVAATPVDNTTYVADANFGDGDDIGTDEFVVYSGTGTSVNVTGLSGNTTYHFAVFEFNCNGGNEMYLTPANAASQGTINYINTSAIAGSPFCVTSADNASVTVNFTYASTGSFAGSTFTAQLSDASGSFASPVTLGTVASNITGSQSISGTIPAGTLSGTGYRIRVISDAPAITGSDNQSDLVIVLGPENVTAGAPNEDNTQVGISWANPAGCFDEIMVVAKLSAAITASPSGDGSAYTANAAFASGTAFDGGYVVYKATGTSETVTALTNNQTYYFKIFTRKGTAWSSGVEFTAMPMASTTLDYGDLAIVAVNTNQSTGDEISFVAFKTIVTGTAIHFTDNGYERVSAGLWGDTEGTIEIERTGSNIPAGTVITIVGEDGGASPAWGTDFNIYIGGLNDNANWNLASLNGANSFNMNSNDQVWIMQDGTWTNPGGSHDASYDGNILYGWTATGWETAPNYASTEGSTKPSGVECSTTDVYGLSYVDKCKYTGPTTACSKMEWIGRINDPDNWDSYANNTDFNSATPQYRTAGATLAIVAGTFDQGKWAGFKSQEWCDCANWMHLQVPTASTNVTIPNNPNRSILLNDHADSLAVCNNLIFTGSTIKGKDGSQITINGDITFADGVMDFTDSAVTVIVYGDWSQDTVTNFIPGSSTVQFNGNGNQAIALTGDGTQRIDFNHLTIGGTSGTKTFSDDIVINGNLSIANGSAITPLNMELKGNWTNNNTTTAGFNEGTYAVTFSGTSQQTITATYGTETFNTLNITNSSADGVTLGSNMAAYKMDLGTNGVFKAGGTARSITILNPADGNGLDGDATALFDISNLAHNLHIQCESPNIHASAMSLGASSNVYYNRAGDQNMIANLTNYANLTFGGSGTKQLIAGPLNISSSLGITGSAVVNSTINAINIGKNYEVYGDAGIDLTNHTVTFNGTTVDQSITGSETFYNLTLDNTGNTLTHNADITVNNNLTLTNGVINTGANTIILGSTATISETDASFVTGNVRTTRNIGSTSGSQAFGGLGLELTESATTDNSTQVTRVTGTALAGNASCCGSNWSIQRYFDIVPTDNTDLNASMVYHYFQHELNGVTETDLVMFRADLPFAGADPWTAMKGTVNTTANTVSLSGLTKFSRWAAASEASPLPVELLYFTATLQGKEVMLNWATASETNNAYFTIERSSDLKNILPIATISGAGNSNTMLQYQNIDEQPLPGVSYYRLRQTDFDGTTTFGRWAKVINAAADKELQIIKAVAKNNALNVIISCPGKAAYMLEVYDITGNRLYSGMVQPDSDWMQHDLPLLQPQNMYIIKASNAQTVKTLKIVK